MILIKIVLFILKIIGLAPFYIKISKPKTPMPIKDKLMEFHCSDFAFFYNIFLLLGSMVAFSLVVVYFSTFIVHYQSEFDSMSEMVINVLTVLTICSIWLTVILKQKVIVDIANDLAAVDINFSLLGLDSKSRGNQTNSFILFLIIGIMWGTTFTLQILHRTWGVIDTFVKILMVPISSFVVEYAVILNIMANKFKSLHNRFLYMTDINFSRDSQVLLRMPYHQSKIIYFKALRKTFTSIYQCGQRVQRSYSFIILIVCVFLRVAFFYFCAVTITDIFSAKEEWSAIVAIGGIIDIIIVFSPMTVLCISVFQFQKTMKDTNRMTQKLLLHYIDDDELVSELRLFAIDSIDRNIRFMAYGFFDLDCSLVLSILDVTLTDLIFILQFSIKQMKTEENDYIE